MIFKDNTHTHTHGAPYKSNATSGWLGLTFPGTANQPAEAGKMSPGLIVPLEAALH